MKRWIPILAIFAVAALAPAPIKDPRVLVREAELTDAQRQQQQRGVTMGEVGGVPDDTEKLPVPSITGDPDAAAAVRAAKDGNGDPEAVRKGAAAIQEASREIAQRGKTNWGRIFAGGIIVVAAFGLFQVFRMWANKALPDAPAPYR
jgi:hypothetical protein